MKLFEYMGKDLFANVGIPIPAGRVVTSVNEIDDVFFNDDLVVKAQILSGKRGKAGGIRFTGNQEEVREATQDLLGSQLNEYPVNEVLVEEKLSIEAEYYLAITIDREQRCPVILASTEGGMDIEESDPSKLICFPVDPLIGLMPFMTRSIAQRLRFTGSEKTQMEEIIRILYQLYEEIDAELIEINPLVLTDGKLIAADAKVTIDSDALYRQKEVPRVSQRSASEESAADLGLAYVELDGDIGVMANGAGITMATLDLIQYYGGEAANFLDAGGGAGRASTFKALKLLIGQKPRSILINIFGGITRCDDVALAIVEAVEETGTKIPMAVRLVGTNQEEGWEILARAGIQSRGTMDEVAKEAVQLAKMAKGGE